MSKVILDGDTLTSWGVLHVHPQTGKERDCPTGERYVTVCSGGVKLEGDPVPALCATEELAIKLFKDALREYVQSRLSEKPNGTLYWRKPPEVSTVHLKAENLSYKEQGYVVYFVYCRVVIS